MRLALVGSLFALVSCAATADTRAPALERELTQLAQRFEGEVGVYVRHLASGSTVAIRADELFPSASMVKVPILIGVFDKLERDELQYRQALRYDKSRAYPGEDLLARFEDGATLPLAELIALMETFSDNTASLWCQELAGGGAAINAWLDAHDFEHTRVNSRTEGRQAAQKEFGWGQTTPREMAELCVWIRERRAVSAAASEEMDRVLSRSYWTGEALTPIPPGTHVLSKQGAVNRSRSEVLLVNAPHGAYVLCVITKNQRDESWEHDNAGFVLLRDVSAAVWRAFEPDHPHAAPPGAERYR